MSNDTSLTSTRNKRLDIFDQEEIKEWTVSMKVSRAQLQAAVRKVGNDVDKVREFLHPDEVSEAEEESNRTRWQRALDEETK